MMYQAIIGHQQYKATLFDMFGRDMLIESLLKVEEKVVPTPLDDSLELNGSISGVGPPNISIFLI